MSAIGAALLAQKHLKVAGFWSQLDTNDREDNDKGGKDVVDKDDDDNDNDNVMEEMPMDK